MAKRTEDFKAFALIVSKHIENYTVPQYGDAPDDPIEDWTPAQCMDSVKRYVSRINSNQRGHLESLRDMVKIAHLACLAFEKLKPSVEEVMLIKRGFTTLPATESTIDFF